MDTAENTVASTPSLPSVEVSTESARTLGKVFWNLMRLWGIRPKDQALLLGVKFHATKLKEWESKGIIPQDPDKFNRVGHLAGIHKNLRILFPYNRKAAYLFMTTPQPHLLGGKSPMGIIAEGGEINSFASIAAIRRLLDQVRVR